MAKRYALDIQGVNFVDTKLKSIKKMYIANSQLSNPANVNVVVDDADIAGGSSIDTNTFYFIRNVKIPEGATLCLEDLRADSIFTVAGDTFSSTNIIPSSTILISCSDSGDRVDVIIEA